MSSRMDEGRAYSWLGVTRQPLRSRFFDAWRRAFASREGRETFADTLRDFERSEPPARERLREVEARVYPDLGVAASMSSSHPAPLFITGRFRSGSTLMWNLFRHVDGCRSYYEPLNERRWFDPARRGSHTDTTHVGVSDYWHEYEGLEYLGGVFHDDWAHRNLYMDANFWDADLKAYVRGLIEAAGPTRAVLQFNRVDFRLPWLRRNFPQARLLHVYRHPRDQWCSALGDLSAFAKDGRVEDFEPHDRFYLLSWAEDLRHHFPFLDVRRARHPYQLFYSLWKLSWLYGRAYADHSVEFERLLRTPDLELPRMLKALGMAHPDLSQLKALIAPQPTGKWRSYADDEWFSRLESESETQIAAFLESDDVATVARLRDDLRRDPAESAVLRAARRAGHWSGHRDSGR
jgi:hypothetical protein